MSKSQRLTIAAKGQTKRLYFPRVSESTNGTRKLSINCVIRKRTSNEMNTHETKRFLQVIKRRHKTDALILRDFQNDESEIKRLLLETKCSNDGSVKTISLFRQFGNDINAETATATNGNGESIKTVNKAIQAAASPQPYQTKQNESNALKTPVNVKQTATATTATNGKQAKECESVLIDEIRFSNCKKNQVSLQRLYKGEMINFCGNCSFEFTKHRKAIDA